MQTPSLAVGAIARAGLSVAGTAAGIALLYAFLAAPNSGDAMYKGWYALVAIAVAVVIAQVVVVPKSLVPTLLSSRPAVALGHISYSLYLWHWPLLLVITEDRTGLTGLSLFLARVAASLAAACVSYFGVERRMMAARSNRRPVPERALTVRVPRRAASTSAGDRGDGRLQRDQCLIHTLSSGGPSVGSRPQSAEKA
jgi:peptidoglycan/LPS O-acetylase OafA/YrhL